MQDIAWLGPCPAEEDAVQVGVDDYSRKARGQSRRYIEAIRKVCGPEPEGARLKIKTERHEYGDYLEVVIQFDGVNDSERTSMVLSGIVGKRLTYRDSSLPVA